MKKISSLIIFLFILSCVKEKEEEDFQLIDMKDLVDVVFDAENEINPEIFYEEYVEKIQCEKCNDGKECTEDQCNKDGGCVYKLSEEFCLINGLCLKKGETTEECKYCDPEINQFEYLLKEDGFSCNDGNECTYEDKCEKGICKGKKTSCNDNNPCTADFCDPQKGCINQPITGYCDDGNLCTTKDYCENGMCIGGVINECNDNNPCTEDYCDSTSGKCFHKNLDGVLCDDGNKCTLNETCDNGSCKSEGELNCNDGNICTKDGCDKVIGCYHDIEENPCCEEGVSVCDDGNPCTDDNCNPQTWKCIQTFNNAGCDDGKKCTEVDTCNNGNCIGKIKKCDDGNPCTEDICEENKGCVNKSLYGTHCDDGLSCSVDDHCENGKCVSDKSQCGCIQEFSDIVSKINSIAVGENGLLGNGLDIDENPLSCSPAGNCSAGIDNSLGAIGSIGNPSLMKALTDGELIVLFEHKELKTDGSPYILAAYAGKLDPSNEDCNFQVVKCDYVVQKESINNTTCKPVVAFDNTKIVGNKLTAGGKKYNFPFELPLLGGVKMPVNLYFARIEANVTLKDGKISKMNGLLAGAVPKSQIIEGIKKTPDEKLPIDKESIIQLIDLLVFEDIDTDGNGKNDASSIGIKFSTIEGKITGVK